jgi:hypothetical protein
MVSQTVAAMSILSYLQHRSYRPIHGHLGNTDRKNGPNRAVNGSATARYQTDTNRRNALEWLANGADLFHMAGPSSTTSIPNRRRGRRHRLDIPASLAPVGADPGRPGITVRICELSVAGVGLRAEQPLEVGHVYEVRAFDTLVPTGMRVKIISHRPAAAGGFEIGAESL